MRFPSHLLWLGFVLAALLVTMPCVQAQETRVPELVAALKSSDPAVRLAAVSLMSDLGQSSLSRLREEGEPILRALRQAGPEVRKVSETDPDIRVRKAALKALGQIRAEGSVAAGAWSTALKDKDAQVRQEAVDAVGMYVIRTLEAIRSPLRFAERLPLMNQMVRDAGHFPPVLRTALGDPDPDVQAAAARATMQLLRGISMGNIDQLDIAGNEGAYKELKVSLPGLASGLKDLTPGLARALEGTTGVTPVPRHQIEAARVLEMMAQLRDARLEPQRYDEPRGDPKKGYFPRLPGPKVEPRGRLLRDDLGEEGKEAANLLTQGLKQAVPAIARTTDSANNQVQLAALDALETIGQDAKPAVPAVARLLADDDRYVRWAAARTLGSIGPAKNPTAVKGLARLLKDDDLDVRSAASQALEMYGAEAVAAVPALAQAVAHGDSELQVNAVSALSAIGPEAAQAVPALIQGMKAADVRVRRLIPPLLGKLGAAAKPAVPALQAALSDTDLEVRQRAGEALVKILGTK